MSKGTCGTTDESTSDTCGRAEGWGRDVSAGPCKDHMPYETGDTADNEEPGGAADTPDRGAIEDACDTLSAAILGASDERPKSMPDKPDSDATAIMLIRKANMGKTGYSTMFGTCDHDGCDRGCSGFGADTCDQHEPEADTSDTSGDGDTITVTINGDEVTGTPEDIRALKGL